MFNKNSKRQKQRDFYKKTQTNLNSKRKDIDKISLAPRRTTPQSVWFYKAPPIIISVVSFIALCVTLQGLAMAWHNIGSKEPKGYWSNFGVIPYFFLFIPVCLILYSFSLRKAKAVWHNNNEHLISDDLEEYTNDSYVRTMDHLSQELMVAPDAGLGFDGHVSTIMGHAMMSNKGIKKIKMPVYDKNVDGFVKRDVEGNIVYETVPMFDKDFGHMLYDMTGVPMEFREFYNATDFDYNRKLTKKEGGDGKRRAGTYDRHPYDKLSDYINNEFYVLDTETQRPAGVYFYDHRPVNTILIAITRGGKGQTYIEPAFDLWRREKEKWNLFTTDPKGGVPRSIVKSYSITKFCKRTNNLLIGMIGVTTLKQHSNTPACV